MLLALTMHAQVSLSEIIQDKEDMADTYYGTFKYQGKAYTGNAISYHTNGKVKSIRGFKEGKYHGMWTEWYENGYRKFQGDRIANKGHGQTRWWHPNGQLKKQGTYDMDKQQGGVVYWYPNGQLKQIRYYHQDQAVGQWTTFDESGNVLEEGDDTHKFFRPFFGADVAPEGFEETSPSFTQDGKTIAFARYKDWELKVPYIASLIDGQWVKQQLNFVDTLYNLSISPNGNRIIFKTIEKAKNTEISRVFVVDKSNGQWGEPLEVKALFNIHAGYFQIMDDGKLYFFARSPKTGIYSAAPTGEGAYSEAIWLSDEVSLQDSDSFDVLMHPQEDRLIVSQYYNKEAYPNRGEVGLYYYKKEKSLWKRVKRLPLAYGWAPNITPDGKFVFVRNGNIQTIPLKELGIDW